jgi:AcrR family transcriptional regulator
LNKNKKKTGQGRQKKEQSTKAILSAAANVLSRHGFSGATIARVAKEAGVSRGLLHYHFKNKEEMLATVLQTNMDKAVELTKTVLGNCISAEEFLDKSIFGFRALIKNDPNFFNLLLEGLVAARHNVLIREQLDSNYAAFNITLRKNLSALEKAGYINPVIPVEGLAVLIAGILDGIGIQILAIPDIIEENIIFEYIKKSLMHIMNPENIH